MDIETKNTYKISWVTDPYDEMYSTNNKSILNYLDQTKILNLKVKDLSNSTVYYEYKFMTNNNEILNNIYNLLSNVSFTPLIFPLNITSDFYISLRLKIIRVLVKKYLLTDVSYFSFFYYKDVKLVQPNDKTAIYRNPKFYEKIMSVYLMIPEYLYYITDDAERIRRFNEKFPLVGKDIIIIDNMFFVKYYEPYIQMLNNYL